MDLETPFAYQHDGARFLAQHEQALLADEMGLGKSCQAVVACDLVGAVNVLVFCPAAVRVNWQREFARFSPFDRPCTVLFSGKDALPSSGVVVCSYDLAVAFAPQFKARQWDALVLDEAHYLKERSAKRTKAIYGHSSRIPGIDRRARRVWRLTGTPAPNNASELYTHLKSAGIVDEPYWDFVFRFCAGFESDYGYKITGHKNVDGLKALLEKFMIRRKKEDVMKDLPPITFHEVTVERSAVELDPAFYEQYRVIGKEAFARELGEHDRALRTALAAVAKQSSTGTPTEDKLKVLEAMAGSSATLRRYIALAKLPKICEILHEELKTEMVDKLVLFAVHRDVIEGARERLKEFGAVTLYGGTDPKRRQQNIDKFMKDPKTRVFIGNVVAAGTGITLTSAHEVGFLELDWVPSNNAQAAMRCHRIGQTKHVRVRIFSLAGSVDEDVQKALTRKVRELARIF